MEKKSVALAFLLLIVLLPNVKGDAAPPVTTYYESTYVVNVEGFKDTYFFSYYQQLPRYGNTYVIDLMESNYDSCSPAPGSNSLSLGAVKRSFYEEMGKEKLGDILFNYKNPDPALSPEAISSSDAVFYQNVVLSSAKINCGYKSLDGTAIRNVSYYYTIMGFSNGELIFYLSNRVIGYRNGSSITETFEAPIVKNLSLNFPITPNQTIIIEPNQTSPLNITQSNAAQPNYTNITTHPNPQVEVPFTTKFFCFIKRLFGIKC